MAVTKTITIREDQEEWLKRNYINLSRFVKAKIDEEMAKRARGEKGEREREGGEKEGGD